MSMGACVIIYVHFTCDAVSCYSVARLLHPLTFGSLPSLSICLALRSPRNAVKTATLQSLHLKFLPTDSNHFFIGTNMVSGYFVAILKIC